MGAVLHTLNLRLGPVDLGYIIEHARDRSSLASKSSDEVSLYGSQDLLFTFMSEALSSQMLTS